MPQTAWARIGAKDLVRSVGLEIEDADGPRITGAMRNKSRGAVLDGGACMGKPRAVRRPNGTRVAINTGVEIAQALIGGLKDTDKTVFSPGAHESEEFAVWRPTEIGSGALLRNSESGRLTRRRHEPDLTGTKERHNIALGGDSRRVSFRKFFHRSVSEGHGPNRLVRFRRAEIGVRIVATGFEVTSPGEKKIARVGSPGELSDLLTVVLIERSELTSFPVGCISEPDIPLAPFVQEPCDFRTGRRR